MSTSRGGHFGLKSQSPFCEAQGGILGLVKTFNQEVSGMDVRVIDFDPKSNREAIASALLDELFTKDEPLEVGYFGSKRWTQSVVREELSGEVHSSVVFTPEDVFLVTGGARGVTPHLIRNICSRVPATFLLVGRSDHAVPDELRGHEGLLGLKDMAQLKKEIFTLLSTRGKTTPREVQRLCERVRAYQEIEENLITLRKTGARIEYLALDISHPDQVRLAIPKIQEKYGKITSLIHAAGVLKDGLLETKTEKELEAVLAPKLDGLFSLLDAGISNQLRLICLFSSVAGRFGNPGQADYAAANQILSHIALSRNKANPLCRWIALDWGALEGGMVTPEIADAFLARGIELLPLKDAATAFEGLLLDDRTEYAEVVLGPSKSPSLGSHETMPQKSIELEKTFSIHDHFYLKDHVLAEPVLPMAMGLDLIVQAAKNVFPDLFFHGIRDLKVYQKIAFPEDEQRLIFTVRTLDQNWGITAQVEIFCAQDDRSRPRYRAVVDLGTRKQTVPAFKIPDGLGFKRFEIELENLYDQYLFHGSSLRSIEEISGHSEFGIEGILKSSNPEDLIKNPTQKNWNCDPRILDGMAQLGLIWLGTHKGCIGIPQGLKNYRQFANFPQESVRCYVQISESHTAKSTIDLDFWILSSESQVIAHGQGWEAVFHDSLNAYTTRGKRMAQ